jgi:hypothetical protein
MSPEAEECPLLEDITKQSSEDCDWEHWSLHDSYLQRVVTSFVLKCPINPIANSNPVYSHSTAWQYV